MTPPRGSRRARRRLAAAVVAFGVVAAGCADNDRPRDTSTTTPAPGSIPEDHGLSASLLATVLPSTVGIEGVACGRLASGSGFALTDTLVVTNAHVILGIDRIRVHTFDGAELTGVPVAFDADADLAILQVAEGDFAPLALTDTAPAGSTGVLVGWGTGPVADPRPYRVERGVTVRIEAVGGTQRVERPAWLVSAEIDLGDSGAALIDRTGEVIGVAFATSTGGKGVGYAVRSSALTELVADGLDPNLVVPSC